MRSAIYFAAFLFLAFFSIATNLPAYGQSRSNSTGTGGLNQIRGRIYLPNGKTLENRISVELQSITHGTLSVETDGSGSFSFGGLAPGSYSVVINAGESFETAREYVIIDPEVQTGTIRVTPIPKTITVPIYLQFKRAVALRNEVINAKLSAIPKNAMEDYRQGLELGQAGKNEEAVVEFRNAINNYPLFSQCHTEIGKIRLKTGKLDDATTSFRSALRIDPEDFDAHLNLGIALLNLKKYNEAEPELVSAAYINRSAVTPHYYLGIVFVMKNDLDVARKAFETAKDLKGGKSLPALHKYLGRIYMKKSLDKEAIREFETYIKLLPTAQDAEKIRKDISDLKARQN